ncbi:GH1 family beta-glucosidase [Demequina activiva]|uniref:Beta-glucosidase n=1 Tax=Demequina activiva TaxID=1582364 RepID=A0A919Q1R7_9MICO|nr:GH1 family beta-glucosidase [Demequina activiva]GIG54454.1 beta-glucosidase [Demequina activiva]
MDERPSGTPFPAGFGWGTSTASYQIEGAVDVDGRGPSIWDTFSHTPGRIKDGTTGDRACDHYHRWEEDVALMAELGAPYYRFSLAWPRLQPGAAGGLNDKGVDFYKRLVDAMRDKGVTPWVTAYHWDLPQELEDAGGWPERDTAYRFADYAELAYGALGDHIDIWTTLNEPLCAAHLGYADGEHAPGRQEPANAIRAAHHLNLGHGLALQRWQDSRREGHRFGVTLNVVPAVAATDSPADVDAARRVDAVTNRIFLDPMLTGSYPADLIEDLAPLMDFSHVIDGDLEIIHQPLDDLGINYYQQGIITGPGPDAPDRFRAGVMAVGAGDTGRSDQGLPVTDRGWEIDPDGMVALLHRITDDYDAPPLWITENGSSWFEEPGEDGVVHDDRRIAYLDQHVRAVKRALDEGIDLRGYFVWSLMDNFEWAYGESSRFGLIHVDYDTQVRTPKDSFHWFKDVIARAGLAS